MVPGLSVLTSRRIGVWLPALSLEGLQPACASRFRGARASPGLFRHQYSHTHIHTYTYTYIHTHIHTCIHMHIHTHIHIPFLKIL